MNIRAKDVKGSDGDSMKVGRTGIGNIDHRNVSDACDDRVTINGQIFSVCRKKNPFFLFLLLRNIL